MITFITKDMLTPQMVDDAHRLFAQLSRRFQQPLNELFEDESKAPYIVGYIEDKRLLAMASMAVYKVTSGYKGWIEDVVVDASVRGKQIGRQLVEQLIAKGKQLGLGEILLFSSPDNQAAINLYESEGFKDKRVNVYVKALKQIYPE
ncbi:phosphinothricin acetyltransferase [Capnocytophaga haemolytica]|jgi:acetyltransferase, GNAT family|uniref:Acetyltransferase n=1 Tax=Capnocytophaga haemolytica TaxID=45243 RepID=A0AAX2H1N6_9FLAO|nr:GNAT family N-acetyltransferase [Capnocytophaga haemolytica]AMD85571.1 acetyltransferase [Capnocytophaga haemolytica]SFN87401.1 phosphinothricin acetyltransferase [Capnocytophaga haemolytica]SNV17019.1 putative acetyltransferase [Capnocytophaga haemolytica]